MGSARTWRGAEVAACAVCIVGLLVGATAAPGAGSGPVVCFTSWELGFPQAAVAPFDDMASARALPGQPGWTLHPTLSPDGLSVAYSSENAVYVHDIAAGEATRVTEFGGHVFHPEWSPDGDRLAYWFTGDAERRTGVYVVDTETRHAALVWETRTMARPSWGPTGRQLACQSGQADIVIVDVASGDWRAAVVGRAKDTQPSWSPRGGRLAFVSDRDGPQDIYAADIDGGDVRRLTHEGGAQWPRWTPDGRSVIYGYAQGGTTNLYIVSASGGPRRQLTNHPARETYPSMFDPALAVAGQRARPALWGALRTER